MGTRMKGFMENCCDFIKLLNLRSELKFSEGFKGREDPVDF